jgi:hypothetical protein
MLTYLSYGFSSRAATSPVVSEPGPVRGSEDEGKSSSGRLSDINCSL